MPRMPCRDARTDQTATLYRSITATFHLLISLHTPRAHVSLMVRAPSLFRHRASLPEMSPTETQLRTALDAAVNQIRTTLTLVAGRVSDTLGTMAQSSGRIVERDLLISSQFDLRRNIGAFKRAFSDDLVQRIEADLLPRDLSKRPLTTADWQTLSLVDDTEMEERMFCDRITQQIAHACETELRDLAAYMASLMGTGHADQARNPLRAELVGNALYRAIEAVTAQPDARKLLARELGAALAKAMAECYTLILKNLQRSGVQPAMPSVRQTENRGPSGPAGGAGYATLSGPRNPPTNFGEPPASPPPPASGFYQPAAMGSESSRYMAQGVATGLQGFADSQPAGYRSRPGTRFDGGGYPGHPASQADAQLMTLLRQLTAAASRAEEYDSGLRTSSTQPGTIPGGPFGRTLPDRLLPDRLLPNRLPRDHDRGAATTGTGTGTGTSSGYASQDNPGLSGPAAVNMIRAHRAELVQASGGKLDHMVIDVVGSLFDQILADSRVPPQMARQIARLQLPVLRVALNDPSFFSSRRHPVRRFVNRIASLACAFEEFDDGPGKQFLERVRTLVQEIIDGDFDQIDLYSAKLASLEEFIAEQTHNTLAPRGTEAVLGSKEAELRLQQRYTLQLRAALAPIEMPDYLRDFLSQVWSQALVLAISRDGADSKRSARYRRVGRELVMSIQPKGLPTLRKNFLMQLPALMKDLSEGLALVGWPEAAKHEFLGRLQPAHAESLKALPTSELDHNMLGKQIEQIFGLPMPGNEVPSPTDTVPDVEPEVIARRFSAEEAQRVGLVTESAVDWSATVDIDIDLDVVTEAGDTGPLGADPRYTNDSYANDSSTVSIPGLGVDLPLAGPDPTEPTSGPQLLNHVKIGCAYQMHMKDEWQKVRLAHISGGRSFFVFTSGRKHQETISMTARMLSRMCETKRFRAVESAYLIERATQRARKQLSALGAPSRR